MEESLTTLASYKVDLEMRLLLGKKDKALTTTDRQQKKQKQTSSSKLKKIIVFIVFIVFNLDQLLL